MSEPPTGPPQQLFKLIYKPMPKPPATHSHAVLDVLVAILILATAFNLWISFQVIGTYGTLCGMVGRDYSIIGGCVQRPVGIPTGPPPSRPAYCKTEIVNGVETVTGGIECT